jgi:GTP-binding protein
LLIGLGLFLLSRKSPIVMKILSSEFIVSAPNVKQCPRDGKLQIAFAGRSNVGKSSLINAVVNRKNLVKTSVTPGKTQLINFFLINNLYYFVDLPGYGFARVPKSVTDAWAPMIEEYLRETPKLRVVAVLLDMRREPDDRDARLIKWLKDYEIPALYVMTKADKLNRQEFLRAEKLIQERLGIADRIIPTSSKSGFGIDELRSRIWAVLSGREA